MIRRNSTREELSTAARRVGTAATVATVVLVIVGLVAVVALVRAGKVPDAH